MSKGISFTSFKFSTPFSSMPKGVSTFPKRYLHRSKDFAFFKNENMEKMGKFKFQNTVQPMTKYPEFMERYFKVSSVMEEKEMFPFVHAMSSALRPGRIFVETLYGKKSESEFYKYLKPPSRSTSDSQEDIERQVEEHVKKFGNIAWTPGVMNGQHPTLDYDPEFQDKLFSMSYTLMQSASFESANFFLFNNSSATRIDELEKKSNQSLEKIMRMHGMHDEVYQATSMMKNWYQKYHALPMGTAFVIGVPYDKAQKYVYDSKSFGVPTGKDIRQVASHPETSPRVYSDEEGGLQARLFLCRETMTPSSGLHVVDINNPEEVERYTQGYQVTPMKDIPEYAKVFTHEKTDEEQMFMEEQKALDQEVQSYAKSLRKK